MPLSSQCVSLPLAKRLKELGVRQESLFYWGIIAGRGPELFYEHPGTEMENEDGISGVVSAFTSGELGEMMPKGFRSGKSGNSKEGTFKAYGFTSFDSHCSKTGMRAAFNADTEADCRALMLIHLLEQKIITI